MRLYLPVLFLIAAASTFAMSVELRTDSAPTSPAGTPVVWSAAVVSDSVVGRVWFRYRVRQPDGTSRIWRDYSPDPTFTWVSIEEGTHQIDVFAWAPDKPDLAAATVSYQITSLAGDTPVITPTGNELVYLYSAPPCPEGSRMRVLFRSGESDAQATPWRNCEAGRSINQYLAGLRAGTEYRVRHVVEDPDGGGTFGPGMKLQTSDLGWEPTVSRSILKGPAGENRGIVLQSRPFELTTAIDMDGNVVWYYGAGVRYLTRPIPGGYFIVLIEDQATDDWGQILRVVDVAGNTVAETNAGAINAQLDRLGLSRMTSFHHEARFQDGKFLVLAGTERVLTDVQGDGDVDVLADMILVLDRDLQVEWAWNAFDHLDVTRKALFDQTCGPGTGGCPVIRLATVANDWLHGNALDFTPDGNIIYSARHQDWVIKIDYSNGQGAGGVIWRLGKDGDFRFLSDDPWPWFSHQHDPNYVSDNEIVVFDNGNTRVAVNDAQHSRGQVIRLNEAQRTATLELNVDLGYYSLALGSAQKLRNGNYHFDVGWMPNRFSRAVEYDAAGRLVSVVETETQQYRSFRMRDMYTP